MNSPALKVKDVAATLGIRTHAVLSLIRSGELRAVNIAQRVGGKPRWRILSDDLEGFLSRRTHQPAGPRQRRRKPKHQVTQYF
jgi:hypothetical protein